MKPKAKLLPIDAPTTRERILEASRSLFNQLGVQGAPVFRIARELGISPGNLTYHFPAKRDILAELLDQLEQRVTDAIRDQSSPLAPDTVVHNLVCILEALWSCRFLFNSVSHVTRMDEDLGARIEGIHRAIATALANYIQQVQTRREMRSPAAPNSVDLIAGNIVSVWLHWLRYESIRAHAGGAASATSVRQCLMHHFSIMQPYLSKDFARQMADEIARQVPAGGEMAWQS